MAFSPEQTELPELYGNHLVGDLESGCFADITVSMDYIYIWTIRVTDAELGSGRAQQMMDEIHAIAAEAECHKILGKFSPDKEKEARVRRFYERNGFSIDISNNLRKEIIAEP